ncbi:NAD(P)/FAD-dependent oxidoreductase [Salinirubrum litoreum]|uniref:NAD(P)/FAD-dependent oxidoreductase n=1 Tax=Salinirubrum litoreum TaxID=1126234 RepID=A0ABD5RBE1_9EURY|nr:FAD-dependent oxidoreductase [Salinirubrum litoreum]
MTGTSAENGSDTPTGTPSVAVVGAGAVGLTAAVDLARWGLDVTVFDRSGVAAGATGSAAGIVYDAYAEDVDAALATRAIERFREFSAETAPVGAPETGPGTGATTTFQFTDCPYVIVARAGDEQTAEAVEASADRMRHHGLDVSVVGPTTLGERFPIQTADVAVAAVAENAGWCDPESYARLLAGRADAVGVDLQPTTAVGLSREPRGVTVGRVSRRFDAVLVAAGAHTGRLCARADIPLALKPYRVQALTSLGAYDGPMLYDATAGFYCRPHPTGLLGGDGTEPVEADPDDWDEAADDWFRNDLRTGLTHRLDYRPRVERSWAGLCTATPDGDPLLGEVAPGIFVAAGWQGHGFMRAPAHGERIAAQIAESLGRPVEGVTAGVESFDPTRFAGDEEFRIVEGITVE